MKKLIALLLVLVMVGVSFFKMVVIWADVKKNIAWFQVMSNDGPPIAPPMIPRHSRVFRELLAEAEPSAKAGSDLSDVRRK